MHGREAEAEENIRLIEHEVRGVRPEARAGRREPGDRDPARPSRTATCPVKVLFRSTRRGPILGATLMITQSFLYNAIFFTYTLVLTKFYGIDGDGRAAVPDRLRGRQPGRSADARAPVRHDRAAQDDRRHLPALGRAAGHHRRCCSRPACSTRITQTLAWCIIFFFASAGASAAYLTVSEIFPLEIRAQAIAVFFAIAQCFGAIGPIFYG